MCISNVSFFRMWLDRKARLELPRSTMDRRRGSRRCCKVFVTAVTLTDIFALLNLLGYHAEEEIYPTVPQQRGQKRGEFCSLVG